MDGDFAAKSVAEDESRAGAVFPIDPLEDPRWDQFVLRHPLGKICHLSGWKNALEGSFDRMKGCYLAFSDSGNQEIRAALPLFEVNAWFKGKRFVSIPFATLSDPLASSSRDREILLDAAVRLCDTSGASSIEIHASEDLAEIGDNRFSRHAYLKTHSLVLDRKPEELLKTFHRTCVRQRIARADAGGLRLRRGEDEKDIDIFYGLYGATRKRLGLPPQPRQFFRLLWRAFAPAGLMTLLFAERDGRTLAALLLFQFKKRMSAEFLGWDSRCRDISPNHYLFWEAIKSACSGGFDVFDFGATSPSNTTLMEFKHHWGTSVSDIVTYCYPLRQRDISEEKEQSHAYRMTRKVCRYIPCQLLEILGNYIYRRCW